ncbi:helix-turn-helix transcriptional regulator [Sessilibacter corallicola]|uniref:helix-turn-helix transcriptional regulator n=1 Tax=Sessilibacter corallicola TaxID=2904075 RepID=UPI001E305189|nr:hypothetical protein [Sessilibacter corallicola]MCE2028997.1 hypothetical protein [Sessilibacter corallicola]
MSKSKYQIILLRRADALKRFGAKSTWFHDRVKAGLLPPPVSLGVRAKGWPEHELDQVLAFMVAGKSDDDIRTLVNHLVEKRQQLTKGVA